MPNFLLLAAGYRLFCHIARNGQGISLEDLVIVVHLIRSTRAEEGLEVHAWVDRNPDEKARRATDAQRAQVRIRRNRFRRD
jgi:hypothetical protein